MRERPSPKSYDQVAELSQMDCSPSIVYFAKSATSTSNEMNTRHLKVLLMDNILGFASKKHNRHQKKKASRKKMIGIKKDMNMDPLRRGRRGRKEGRKKGGRQGRTEERKERKEGRQGRQGRKEARKEGSKEERKEGRKEGGKEGRKEGRKQGRKEGKVGSKEERKEGRKEARKEGSKEERKEARKEGSKEERKEGRKAAGKDGKEARKKDALSVNSSIWHSKFLDASKEGRRKVGRHPLQRQEQHLWGRLCALPPTPLQLF